MNPENGFFKFIDPYIIPLAVKADKDSLGDVYRGVNIQNHSMVNVKMIQKQKINIEDSQLSESFMKILEITDQKECQNVSKLLGLKMSQNNIYIISQLDEGSLEDLLNKREKLSETEALFIIKQLVKGYQWLHEHKIIHCHLSPSSVLIKDETYKISDYWLVKYNQNITKINEIYKVLNPMYVAPELLFGSAFSDESDVWSMGAIFYRMIYGQLPLKVSSLNGIINGAHKNYVNFPYKLLTPGLQQLLQLMLKCKPEQRLLWKDIFELDVLKENTKNLLTIEDVIVKAKYKEKDELKVLIDACYMYYDQRLLILEAQIKAQTKIAPLKVNYEQQNVYYLILKQYEANHLRRISNQKIKNWFLRRRNTAIFLNHVLLKFYYCIPLLNLPNVLAEIYLLIICKKHITITFTDYSRLKQGKIVDKSIDQQCAQQFFLDNSALCNQLKDQLKEDFKITKVLLDQLLKNILGYLNKGVDLPSNFSNIKDICNAHTVNKQQFAPYFNFAVENIIQMVTSAMAAGPKNRQLIELAFLLSWAEKIKEGIINNEDFPVIYETAKRLVDQKHIDKLNKTEQQYS